MENFDYWVPTEILFGKDKIEELAIRIRKNGERVLFVYGSASIKRTGLYETVVKILEENNLFFKELAGVMPNPRITSVRRGVKICQENNLDFILAVGGGSVIDCAKAIAGGFYYDGDPWDFFLKKAEVTKALPLGAVLTLSATGSEMNGFTVISNEQTQDKLPAGGDCLRPKFSVLDPVYTFTVSARQTAAGTCDIYSHILEQYFSLTKGAFVQDKMAEALLKVCIKYGPLAVDDPQNYEARANIMWASSLALNSLLTCGKVTDWATHYIEHSVSAVYDITHGVGLAILTPFWMEYVLSEQTAAKLSEYAQNIWGIDEGDSLTRARKGIEKTREFFKSLGMPGRLRDVGVERDKLSLMAKKTAMFGPIGSFKELKEQDILKILEAAF